MKIVILDGHATNPGDLSWEEVEKLGETAVYPRSTAAQAIEDWGCGGSADQQSAHYARDNGCMSEHTLCRVDFDRN